jgi:hypothetical protein
LDGQDTDSPASEEEADQQRSEAEEAEESEQERIGSEDGSLFEREACADDVETAKAKADAEDRYVN